jgi:hypothetical protein
MKYRAIVVAAVLMAPAWSLTARADGNTITPPKPHTPGPNQPLEGGGNVTVKQINNDKGMPTIMSIDVGPTGAGGGTISLKPADQKNFHYDFAATSPSSHTFAIPASIVDANGDTQKVSDYHETATLFAAGPTPADTHVTAYYFDPGSSQFITFSAFAAVITAAGPFGEVDYPILTVGTTAPLFSDIIVNVFAAPPPVLTIGETFSFVNGSSADLPGVLLSTTPFGFDPNLGPTGEGFNGTATVAGIDAISVPEPPAAALLAVGAVSALVASIRRRARRLRPAA